MDETVSRMNHIAEVSDPAAAMHGIAHSDAGALSVPQIEERRIIHRADHMREQADAFRELRTRLLGRGEGNATVTMVAPVRHGCGGSFVARNLAAAFAFDESREAMLIDCDVRHPSQAAALRMGRDGPGLIEYLQRPDTPIAGLARPTGLPRLWFIASGDVRESPGEAFTSARMRLLIDSLRAQHARRHIVLDSPPVEGSPDARILSELADVVVLVAGYGRVTPEAVQQAAANFPAERLAGVVFNERP